MDTVIRFKVKKDLDNKQHKRLLELKGALIRDGYTDIIHIHDDGEEFHINSFVPNGSREDIVAVINQYCSNHGLQDFLNVL